MEGGVGGVGNGPKVKEWEMETKVIMRMNPSKMISIFESKLPKSCFFHTNGYSTQAPSKD